MEIVIKLNDSKKENLLRQLNSNSNFNEIKLTMNVDATTDTLKQDIAKVYDYVMNSKLITIEYHKHTWQTIIYISQDHK